MVGINAYTNNKHNYYNATVQYISLGGGDYYTKVRAMCERFVNMLFPVST